MYTSNIESAESEYVTEFEKNDKQHVSGATQSELVLYKVRDVGLDLKLDDEKIYDFQWRND